MTTPVGTMLENLGVSAKINKVQHSAGGKHSTWVLLTDGVVSDIAKQMSKEQFGYSLKNALMRKVKFFIIII